MAAVDTRDRKVLAIVNAQSKRRDSLSLALIKALLGLWGGFKAFDDPELVQAHAARSAILVDTSLTKARRNARSYATTMLRTVDAPVSNLPKLEEVYPRSGADLLEVYQRPVHQWLRNRNLGMQEAERQQQLDERIRNIASTDIMLATRDETAKVFAESTKVIGRRRIIHPELSASGFSCGLCVIAADRVYYSGDLMAIHNGCNCTEACITAGYDPGAQLNRADLDTWYNLAGSTAAEDLVDLRVSVDEHGELGPILRRGDQRFRDVEDVNANSRKKFTAYTPRSLDEQRASWADSIERSNRAIIRLQAAVDQGLSSTDLTEAGVTKTVSDFTSALKYHRDLVSRFESKLRAA